jgi:hypothetical protein
MMGINPNKLKFRPYDPLTDSLDNLDFTQTNGSDPLFVEEYTKTHMPKEAENKNNKIYVVSYEGKIIAFFTLSMSVICSRNLLNEEDGNEHDYAILKESVFPALLMGKVGIDKKYRCFGIGKYICLFCIGLAHKTSEKIACSFFIFRTTKSLAEKIYGPKYYFRWKSTQNKLVWVYRKIT